MTVKRNNGGYNPYQSPADSDSLICAGRYTRTSRFMFLYVVGLIFSLALVVTLFVAQRNNMPILDCLAFFGLTVSGPLVTLVFIGWGIGPWTVPIWSVSVLSFVTTLLYLYKPNRVSLIVSSLGALIWVSIPIILIVVFPALHIRL